MEKRNDTNNQNMNTRNPRQQVRRRNINNIPNKKVKKWSSIWGKWIIIWIWIFILLIVLIIFFFFFYLTSHPNTAKWLGMWPSTIKSITSVFAWILFGTLFVVFLIMWLLYVYKLATKPTWKIWNTIWTIVIFILWTANIIFWWIVFQKIWNIKTDDVIQSKDVLIANIQYSDKDWKTKIIPLYKNNYPLIWPIKVSFLLNKNLFTRLYIPSITSKEWWGIIPDKFLLDCGNWQKLVYNSYDFWINKYCLYLKKWNYNVKFSFYYSTKNKKNQVFELPWKTIQVNSNLIIKTKYKLNDKKNEIILWQVWDLIKLDLWKIPSDLSLEWNDIEISFNEKEKFKKFKWIAIYKYKNDWLYNLKIKIPSENIEYPIYTFPVRIEPSDKPTCNISYKIYKNNTNKYLIKINWTSPNWSIIKTEWKISNITNSEIYKKWKGKIFKVDLNNWSDYQIKAIITDSKKNKWECTSTTINLSDKINYKYDVYVNNKLLSWNTIDVPVLPSTYNIKIKNISPNSDNIDIWFDIDGDWQIDEKWNTFETKIKSKKKKKIWVIVNDIYWNKSIKYINFIVKEKPVIAIINSNKYKWNAPLKINFDGSSSKVNNSWDNIIYFNWDFGDWEKMGNTRIWNIEHTYKEAWTYIVKLTVITEKWFKDTTTKKIFVLKNVKTSNIVFPNNLWWQIQVWESLKIGLRTSWAIKSIERDFGDSNTFSCEWRQCSNINHTYKKKWLYKIRAKVYYIDNSPSTTATNSINVIK